MSFLTQDQTQENRRAPVRKRFIVPPLRLSYSEVVQ
jgi:hypothetical protein